MTSTPSQDPAQTARGSTKHPFLTRPLYVYDLPTGLVDSLKLRSIDARDPTELFHATPAASEPSSAEQSRAAMPASQLSGAKVPPCTLCPSCKPFSSVSAQRAHFRSDWHRYNVLLNVKTTTLVDEQAFDRLCEEIDTSGETESDEEAGKEQAKVRAHDTISRLLEKLDLKGASERKGAPNDSDDDEYGDDRSARNAVTARSPLLWFTSREDASAEDRMAQTQLGVYRSIFPDPGAPAAPSVDPRVGAAEWYRACLSVMQAGRLTRKPTKNTNFTGRRLKASGAQDAAKVMMMTVLDGEGYIPGLKLEVGRDSSEEEDSELSEVDEEDDADDAVSNAPTSSTIARNPETKDPPIRMWTVLLMGGGHFAASIIALNPHVTTTKGRKGAGPKEERGLLVLAHKTFHRYTTRRKQGGSQALQDATGRFAKSAGATLRRYNEEELGNDIRRLLDSPGWRELVGRSEKVWIRAGARAAKGILWGWEGGRAAHASPLDPAKEDGRMDHLPFPTRRPTIGETIRCFIELTRVKIERKTDAELEALDQAYRDSLSSRTRKEDEIQQRDKAQRERVAEAERKKKEKEAATPKLSDEEKVARGKVERMVDMVRKGRLEALTNFLSKNEDGVLGINSAAVDDADEASELAKKRIDSSLPDWWLAEECQGANDSKLIPCNLLQLAAEGGSEEMIRYLLIDRRADPTIKAERAIDIRNRTTQGDDAKHRAAYDLCSTKEARNVFRRAMAEHPDWYDWVKDARVPSALTAEMEETQTGKQKDRRALLREKAKERAAKAPEVSEPEPEPVVQQKESHKSTNRLGGATAAPRALLQQRDGLTPEMRARVEREQRARAAEARMKALAEKKE